MQLSPYGFSLGNRCIHISFPCRLLAEDNRSPSTTLCPLRSLTLRYVISYNIMGLCF